MVKQWPNLNEVLKIVLTQHNAYESRLGFTLYQFSFANIHDVIKGTLQIITYTKFIFMFEGVVKGV